MIDLHLHSYYSDGVYSPQDLMKKAKQAGLSFLSLTDHNGIDGIKEFQEEGKKLKIKVITGVEIYTHFKDKHLHLLGYGFDLKNKKLDSVLKELQASHLFKIKKIIKILQKNGWQMDEREVFKIKAPYIGVANLAGVFQKYPRNQNRIKKDFNWTPKKIISLTDIVEKYFFKNGVSLCPETELDIKQAIKLIKQAHGKAVLAHPGQQLAWHDQNIIKELKKSGLDGLEAISSHHSWGSNEHWQKVAKELNLTITVGSDFHGILPKEWGFDINSVWDYFKINNENFICRF